MNPEKVFDHARSIVENDPSRIVAYPVFNKGRFGGSHGKGVFEMGEVPNIPEQISFGIIDHLLEHNETVVVVDAGAQCALSLVLAGVRYADEVDRGRLALVATNVEQDFSIQTALEDSVRRLRLLDEYLELIHAVSSKYPVAYEKGILPRDILWLITSMRPILNTEEIRIIAQHHHRVEYISGVKSADIPEAVRQRTGQPNAHFLHEFYGAIKNSDVLSSVLMLSRFMAPGGIVMTPEKLHDADEAYANIRSKRNITISLVDQIGVPDTYIIYPFDGAHAWIRPLVDARYKTV